MSGMLFRWFPLGLLVVALAISGYYRSRARIGSETIARRREGGAFMAARALIALPTLLAVIVGTVSPSAMRWASVELPGWARWSGVVLGLLTLPAAYWVLSSLGKNVSETVLTKSDHALVTIGPYRWIRHPLYTTGMAMFIALGLVQESWLILSLAAVALVLIHIVVIPAEERALVAKFGDRYRGYMTGTGRMLPKLSALH
jgi:protein-S-isoprenylcysteine O-methyltransferase Ste14